MALPEEAVRVLNVTKEKILDVEARNKFRPGSEFWDRAMNAARALLGIRKEETAHLAEFLSLSNRESSYVVCIACGIPVPREHQVVTTGPKEILDKAATVNPLLRGLYRALGLETPKAKIPIQNRGLINGFCELCQESRRIPDKFRIGDAPAPRPLRFRTNSVEEAVLFLRRNHVVFDEEHFRIIWRRSIQLNI